MADSIPPFAQLPELTLSLRSFGSRRGRGRGRANSSDATPEHDIQERYFAPLLEARRRAAAATAPEAIVSAFDGRRLTALFDAMMRAFAAERFTKKLPARRAFEAELFELVAPLRTALHRLRECGDAFTAAAAAEQQQQCWAVWVTQLQATFRIADDGWPPLLEALEAPSLQPREERGLRSRTTGRQ
jgi:hypothetical protein